VPSIPGCPKIVKVVGKEVTLTWTQPDSDGGPEITGYLIAVANQNGSILRHVPVGVTTTAKLNKEFVSGGSYCFAVAAKNALGFGDFSLLSEDVQISDDIGNEMFITFHCLSF